MRSYKHLESQLILTIMRGLLLSLFAKQYLYQRLIVCFQTTRSQFDLPQYNVRRRYQDFLWLRQRLQESYQTHIIPVRIIIM